MLIIACLNVRLKIALFNVKKGDLMDNVFDMKDFIGTSQGDKEHMLGKFLYFSLSNLLVEKEALAQLCEEMDIPYTGGKRLSV